MSAKIICLFAFVVLYWVYCIYWGWRSAQMAKTASDYFIAGRKLSLWVKQAAPNWSPWEILDERGD